MRTNSLFPWWVSMLLYGVALGLLLASLRFSRFRLLVSDTHESWYVGAVALLFAGLGGWAVWRWRQQATLPLRQPLSATDMHQKIGLTTRELEVLQLMAHGLSNQQIAERLFISLNTVKTHASNVLTKLDAQRRTQAIQRAKELGILP